MRLWKEDRLLDRFIYMNMKIINEDNSSYGEKIYERGVKIFYKR